MAHKLDGKRIAILVEDGFEQVELTGPSAALEHAGAKGADRVSVEGKGEGWKSGDWGDSFPVDVPPGERAADFDGRVLPGGVLDPDKLRLEPAAVALVKAFLAAKKTVASICHGPWTLIEAAGRPRAADDLVAPAADRPRQRRREVGRRGGDHGPGRNLRAAARMTSPRSRAGSSRSCSAAHPAKHKAA